MARRKNSFKTDEEKAAEANVDVHEAEPEAAPAQDSGDVNPDEVHVERAHRSIKRPFTDEERGIWTKQLTRATLKIRELRNKKSMAIKAANQRIEAQQGEAITAAESLEVGGTVRYLPCECVFDWATKTYKEIAEDTREVVTCLPLTLEEIDRFRKRTLPGHVPESWLTPQEALKKAEEEDWEDDGDLSSEESEGLASEEEPGDDD